jgi:hypothetical protein
MRPFWLGLGIVVAVAACSTHRMETVGPEATTSSGSAGIVTQLSLQGQVPVAHPPGTRDAVDQVRREAAARCPGGFVIRSLRTDDAPSASDFLYHTQTYQAVVDCNPGPFGYGGSR